MKKVLQLLLNNDIMNELISCYKIIENEETLKNMSDLKFDELDKLATGYLKNNK